MNFKEFFSLGPVFGYFFRKNDSNRPKNFELKMMNGVNKIALIVFLIGIIFFIAKVILRNL